MFGKHVSMMQGTLSMMEEQKKKERDSYSSSISLGFQILEMKWHYQGSCFFGHDRLKGQTSPGGDGLHTDGQSPKDRTATCPPEPIVQPQFTAHQYVQSTPKPKKTRLVHWDEHGEHYKGEALKKELKIGTMA